MATINVHVYQIFLVHRDTKNCFQGAKLPGFLVSETPKMVVETQNLGLGPNYGIGCIFFKISKVLRKPNLRSQIPSMIY